MGWDIFLHIKKINGNFDKLKVHFLKKEFCHFSEVESALLIKLALIPQPQAYNGYKLWIRF